MIQRAIKPNSHTQRIGSSLIMAMGDMILKMGIRRYDWDALMFEYGMRYLYNCYTPEEARDIASSPDTGFWASWIECWADDDQKLLQLHQGYGYTFSQYMTDKILLTEKPSVINEKV